jgi:hypothetical protein
MVKIQFMITYYLNLIDNRKEVTGMAGGYTKSQIYEQLEYAAQDMPVFYKQNFINYCGVTIDSKEFYTEIVSEWLLKNMYLFSQIPAITRTASYKTSSHNGVTNSSHSNRTEELIAMEMFRQETLPLLGKVLDYQTPLKDKRSDRAGKIDLLAYDGETLRILELKEPDSNESMLRCVLEGFTYLKTVDKDKVLKDFSLPCNTPIKASPFVFYDGAQKQEMDENRPQIKQLMYCLDSNPFYIRKHGNLYHLTED